MTATARLGIQRGTATHNFTLDVVAPSAVWTPPGSLTVNQPIADITPESPSDDVRTSGGYRADGLPPGLTINADTGVISGTPPPRRRKRPPPPSPSPT